MHRIRFRRYLLQQQGVAFKYLPGTSLTSMGATFSRGSTATYVDANGVVQTASSGVARDGHYVGGVRSLLLEGQRTNKMLWSGDLTNVAWTSRGTAGTGGKADPSGGTSGYEKILSGSGAQDVFQSLAAATFTNSATLATSFWMRVVSVGTGTTLKIINPSDATKTATFTAPVTGVWTPCSVTFAASATGAGGVQFVSGDGSAWTVQIWGVQQEEAAFSSAVIPTTTVAVTRSTDSLSFPGVGTTTTATLFQRYWDEATAAWVDGVSAYTSGTTITPTLYRAYQIIAVLNGTYTAPQAAAILGVP